MAYRRGGFALTPPSIVVFVLSIILALIAVLIRYGVRIPIIDRAYFFEILLIAFLLLVIGVVFRRI